METDPTPNAAQPKSRRRWHQFSARTLLIAAIIIACGLGYWSSLNLKVGRQQADVAAVAWMRGTVAYDYEFNSQGNRVPNAAPPGPAWLHSLLGDDFFRSVYEVDLAQTGGKVIYDADLDNLRFLTQLRLLNLDNTRVTDAGLDHLESFTKLQVLRLKGTQVTDKGIVRLQEALPNCKIVR